MRPIARFSLPFRKGESILVGGYGCERVGPGGHRRTRDRVGCERSPPLREAVGVALHRRVDRDRPEPLGDPAVRPRVAARSRARGLRDHRARTRVRGLPAHGAPGTPRRSLAPPRPHPGRGADPRCQRHRHGHSEFFYVLVVGYAALVFRSRRVVAAYVPYVSAAMFLPPLLTPADNAVTLGNGLVAAPHRRAGGDDRGASRAGRAQPIRLPRARLADDSSEQRHAPGSARARCPGRARRRPDGDEPRTVNPRSRWRPAAAGARASARSFQGTGRARGKRSRSAPTRCAKDRRRRRRSASCRPGG